MPERLDRITVATSRGDVAVPWRSRDALLNEFSDLESSTGLKDAFDAVGATRAVELTNEQKAEIVRLIDFWTTQLGNGYHDLPEGLWNLRNALIDDLHDAGDT